MVLRRVLTPRCLEVGWAAARWPPMAALKRTLAAAKVRLEG